MAQSDYLNQVQHGARLKYQLKQDEQLRKEGFRKNLEIMFQNLLAQKYPGIDPSEVRLRCYGSLNNGFGLTNCDMDLLLALPNELDLINKAALAAQAKAALQVSTPAEAQDVQPLKDSGVVDHNDESQFEVALLIEGILLDNGIGARLLTKTRVPILRVCETPAPELLESLRSYRKECAEAAEMASIKAEDSTADTPPDMSVTEILSALSELSTEDDAAQVSLPGSPPRTKQPALEFIGECGIQCDINFTNFVAVHNTKLLREYCQYDSRVAEIGTFVKTWAKIRDINTPYLGTLSSYGYILLVLHYLMNIVQPPVIPNLQQLAYTEDSWSPQPPTLFEGKYDIRFWQDSEKLQHFKTTQPRNHESTGHLLRGFFWYYSAREGFNFKNDIISIRSRGGVLRKANKGWTEAKWSDQKKNVRQRYLLAIEDPFEIDHNVARVVGHNGIVAIRDEFRRAWSIITAVGGPNPPTSELLEPIHPRGDLLRMDQDHHREKMKKMKQDMEAKQKQALQESLLQSETAGEATAIEAPRQPLEQLESNANGMLKQEASCSEVPSPPTKSTYRRRLPKNKQLTEDVGASQDKPRQQRRGRLRKVEVDSDDEDAVNLSQADVSKSEPRGNQYSDRNDQSHVQNGDEEPEPFCSPSEILRSQGFDLDGNPVAWDITTQDGRWLQWRDNKIRQGIWKGPRNANLIAHDRMYPYDPRRPRPEGTEDFKLANELFYVNQAPYPMNKESDINSTESAIAANIVKSYRENGRLVTGGRRRISARKMSSSKLPTQEQAPAMSSIPVRLHATKSLPQIGPATVPPQTATEQSEWDTPPNYSWDMPTALQCSVGSWLDNQLPEKVSNDISEQIAILEPRSADLATNSEPSESQYQALQVQRDDIHPWSIDKDDTERGRDLNSYLSAPAADYDQFDPLSNYKSRSQLDATSKERKPPAYSAAVESGGHVRPMPLERPAMSAKANGQGDTWPTGFPIEWDMHTAGGRWLRKRDNWIRMGTFTLPRYLCYRDLHERFPYDLRMPVSKLQMLNRELRDCYLYSLWRAEPRSSQSSLKPGPSQSSVKPGPSQSDAEPLFQLIEKPVNTNSEDWPQYSLKQDVPSASAAELLTSLMANTLENQSKADLSTEQDCEAMPDTAFIRSRRLAYYADRERRESLSEHDSAENTKARDITMMMKNAGIDLEKPATSQSYVMSSSNYINSTLKLSKPRPANPNHPDFSQQQASFASSFESEVSGLTRSTEITEQSVADPKGQHLQVPLSLYSDITSDQRPRDEDPRIMPIPRELGFRFDARQLRDLAVIKEGGNGCAVEGYEFEIQEEDDDQWIGSGAVEWGSTVRAAKRPVRTVQYEYGKGDEDGLLDELPGPDI